MEVYREIFNEAFKETMDELGLKSNNLAQVSGRSTTNLALIRRSKSYPTIGDFAELLAAAESIKPGFFETFVRKLIGESRRLGSSPEEFVDSLSPEEFGALMYAVAHRVNGKKDLISLAS